MSFSTLTEDHYDALREIVNIAMGQASAGLAALFDTRVMLHVPDIALTEASSLATELAAVAPKEARQAAVRQAFFGGLNGEAIVLHARTGADLASSLLGYEGPCTEAAEREFYLDTSNMLTGAILGGLTKQLSIDIGYSPPTLLSLQTKAPALARECGQGWEYALRVSIVFRLESHQFECRVLIFLPENAGSALYDALERFLEEYA
ncbi:MAG: hypothetical protein GF331_14940 [Chitinivibrionales bacterium]|nr:hypothetical protein [Chitinivibrionales bacterium]